MNNTVPRLVLHIGQTKAGSTAIQNYLDSQRGELLRHNILVPDLSLSRSNPFDLDRTAGHLSLIRDIARNKIKENLQYEELRSSKHIVLSAENIFLDRPNNEIAAIGKFFYNYEITLVLVVRTTEAWLKSRYVENVMSGFKSCSSTFEEFFQRSVSSGAHDYASRLDSLVKSLSARHVRLINYDAELNNQGVIPAFLLAAGLPTTDLSSANMIRSNVRESHAFLIEAKRRVNYFTRSSSLPLRLELEHKMRFRAREIVTEMQLPAVVWNHEVSFAPNVYSAIVNSNKRLVDEFKLYPSLPDPKQDKRTYYGELPDRIPAEQLTTDGLKIAAGLLKGATGQYIAPSSIPLLNLSGIEEIIDILSHSTVSFHMSGETALWAALYKHRFPVFVSSKNDLKKIKQTSSSLTSSKILHLSEFKERSVFDKDRPSGVFVVPPKIPTSRIISVLNELPEISKLVLLGYGCKKAYNISHQARFKFYKKIGSVHVYDCEA